MADYSSQLSQARKKDPSKSKPASTDSSSDEITGAEFLLIGIIGFINDLLDYFGVDFLLFRIVDFLTAFILGCWCLFRLRKFPSARFGTTFVVELIPFLGDLSPTWTLFIISIYLEQKGYLPNKLSNLSKGKVK